MDRTTLTSETNNWVGVLNLARSEAITRGEKVTVCRSAGDPEDCDGSAQCNCGTVPTPPNYHTGYLIFTSTNNPSEEVAIHFQPTVYGNELLRAGRTQSDKVTIQGNGFANNAFSFAPGGSLATEDFEAGSARHILCLMARAGDSSSTISNDHVRGRVVIIAPTGQPSVSEFAGTGAQCVTASSNENAD